MERYGITVSRRVTGGGAMFMEPGNCITYSLVIPTALVEGMSFEQAYPYLDQWVMEVLDKLGIKAKYVPLNDIASEFGKIGGAAQKRWANGYMVHHVTMAYDIDAIKMNEVLRIGMEKIRDKGTRSAVKRVDPMRSQTGMAREEILQVFFDHFKENTTRASAPSPRQISRSHGSAVRRSSRARSGCTASPDRFRFCGPLRCRFDEAGAGFRV